MNWPRVKTILIFLFLAVDLILLATIIVPSIGIGYIPQETITTTANLLSENGIEISSEIIPAKREQLGVVELYNLWPTRPALAEKIIGKCSVSGNIYKNGSKTLVLNNSDFNYNNDNSEKTLAHELIDIGIDLRENLYEEGNSSVRAWQTVENKKIFESEVYATISDETVTVAGFWIFSDREKGVIINTPDTLVDVTGVLIDFINNPIRDTSTKITSVELGYSAGNGYRDTSHKLVSVSPAYKISCDTGAYFIYDALSGEFIYAYKNGELIY